MMRLPALILAAVVPVLAAASGPQLLVVCSPGSPGRTAEAQPAMDAFARALTARAALTGPFAAVYEPTEEGGLTRLRAADTALALVSFPFYLKHERLLALTAQLVAVPRDGAALERWTLVAKKGRVAGPGALAGFTISSVAGFAPAFVRGPALGGFGPLPAEVKVVQSAAVLSSLRRAAAGEPVAVLLDGAQSAAVSSLPFASELEVVARSVPLPAGVLVTVDARIAGRSWIAVDAALRGMAADPAGALALAGLQLAGFEQIDAGALAAARRTYAGAQR